MLAISVEVAIADLAGFSIVDSVAVAQVEAVGCAKPPNGVLHEPRKIGGKFWIEGPRVNSS